MSMRPQLVDAALVTTLTAALIYVAGWSFAQHWFDHFNLGLIGLGIPLEYHLMYGLWVLWDAWWLLGTLAAAGLAAWRWWVPARRRLREGWPLALLPAFLLFYGLGARCADTEYATLREQDFASLPPVRVWLNGGNSSEPKMQAVITDLAAGGYRLLLKGGGDLYLIKPVMGSEQPVVQIPAGQVRAMRVIPVNPGWH